MLSQKRINLTPPQILALGFLVVILTGTVLLSLPISSADGNPCSLMDALFTATSATCVTGLIVVDTGTFFSLFGQLIIIILIQIGGLGLMTMSVLFALAVGKRIMLKERLIMQEALNQINIEGIVRVTKYLLLLTFLFEGLAALILGVHWIPDLGVKKAFYYGVFHSISAFCNAGFDLFSVSLVNYRGDLIVNLTITFLVIAGGIGATVLFELRSCLVNRHWRLSLHTKMVLTITTVLIVLGMVVIYLLEFHNPESLASLSFREKILTSYFQAVVPRTAGFNTLPIGELYKSTLFFMIIMMFIGASPGSTGGGIKTTTFGTMAALVISIIKGKREVEIFNRTIPSDTISKALSIFLISLGAVVASTMVLLITENANSLEILFEVVSAFGTVGLSMGLTPHLTTTGKLVIIFTMFLGRVGPLTLAFALTQRNKVRSQIKYPEEKITVG